MEEERAARQAGIRDPRLSRRRLKAPTMVLPLPRTWMTRVRTLAVPSNTWRLDVVLLLLLVGAVTAGGTGSDVTEFCLTDTFAAACDDHHVVVMDVAKFGRMKLGRCVTRNYGNVGCYTDVLFQVDAKCSGRHTCSFSVSDADLVRTKPCPQDFASYLEASHHCAKVATIPADYCRGNHDLVLKDSEGYISSIATEDTGCGLQNPWIITALPGQKINLTLYDFSMATQNDSVSLPRRTSYPMYCQQYARVEETDAARSTIICGGEQRVRNVYLSVTHVVEVHVMSRRVHGKAQHFLIKYQVVGCPNVRPPTDTAMRRDGNRVVIICNHTGETTTLSCRGTTWHGDVRNCTPVTPAHIDDDGEGVGLPPIGGLFISPGVSIIIIVGVALVVVVYVAIMIVCVMYLQRRRRRAQQALEDKCHSDPCAADLQLMKPCASSEGLEERVPMLAKPGLQFKSSGLVGLGGLGGVTLGEYTDVRTLRNMGRQNPPPQEISLLEQLNQDLLGEDPGRAAQCECMATYARTCSTFKPKDPIYDQNPNSNNTVATTTSSTTHQSHTPSQAAQTQRGTRCQVISKGVPFYYELDPKNLHHHGGQGGLPGPDLVTVTMCHMKESESESENEVNRLKEQTL